MSRLDRYLAKEILLPFGAALLFLTQILLATQILARADVVLGAGVSAVDLVALVADLTPHLVGYVMPIAFLVGAILGAGRLADDREIVAIGAAGISPLRLVRVPLAIGLAVAALGLWLSTDLDPAGLRRARFLFNDVIKRNLTAGIRSGTFYDDLPQFTVYVADAAPGGWRDVLIADRSDPGAPVLALARHGRLVPVGADEEMRLELEDGELHRRAEADGGYLRATFRRAVVTLGLGTALSDRNDFANSRLELSQAELAARAVVGPGRSAAEALPWDVAYHRRLASPLSVIGFALMAVPIAALRRGGRAAGVGAAVGAVLLQYGLLRAGEVAAKNGLAPPALALELPTVALVLLGLALCWRLQRRGPGAVR